MHVTYTGPYPSVQVDAAGLTVKHGETVEVPDDLGERMLRQASNWTAAPDVDLEVPATVAVEPPAKAAKSRTTDTTKES